MGELVPGEGEPRLRSGDAGRRRRLAAREVGPKLGELLRSG
jgi:hypothetical protein